MRDHEHIATARSKRLPARFAEEAFQTRFHLIEAPTRTIYLPIGDGAPLCERLQRGEVSRTLLRKLGQFSVACYEPQFRALDDAGALELLPDGSAILMDLSKYDEKTGLAMNVETGVGIFI